MSSIFETARVVRLDAKAVYAQLAEVYEWASKEDPNGDGWSCSGMAVVLRDDDTIVGSLHTEIVAFNRDNLCIEIPSFMASYYLPISRARKCMVGEPLTVAEFVGARRGYNDRLRCNEYQVSQWLEKVLS